MCGCQQSRGGAAKASAKNTQLYAMKAGPPIVKLFNIWHFMNKAALFHSQLCVGLDVWHKRFYVNQRTLICYTYGHQFAWTVTETGKVSLKHILACDS